MTAPFPDNEVQRVARLRTLSVLDTAPEPLFDGLAEAAALALGAPVAAVNLVDSHRQWTKAGVGVERVGLAVGRDLAREQAFCGHTILGDGLLEIADARRDERFSRNPLVTAEDGIRFYIGAPITLNDGLCMGALCVIDVKPRMLSDAQRSVLVALANAAAQALELRLESLQREALLDRAGRLASVGGWTLDLATNQIVWTDETCRLHELSPRYRPTLEEALSFYPPDARARLTAAVERARREGTPWDLELPMNTATGRRIWVRALGSVDFADGQPQRLVGAIQDISIRRRVVTALEASERRFRQLFQYSLGLICTHDYEGVLLSVNPAAARALGYSIGELLGRSLAEFMPADRQASFRQYLLRIITSGTDTGVLELTAKDGSRRMWQYHNMLDDEADEPYVLGHAQDITERFELERKLRDWSVHDSLTGCFNRRYLEELDKDSSSRWGCITVDLDHFKQINDTYGHQRGDEVLLDMARFLRRQAQGSDAVVRLGGDEFLLLLRDADAQATEALRARLEAARADAPIAFTLGWATFGGGVSLDEGLAEADRRLYARRAADRGGADRRGG
ncbi:PAS domain S-box protein [Dyella sp.]|jgi:diguanylate cyclase (GGDEF)-like protein/PAS domain S-box-containing protein|uniref:sensor domain-containing diguanylate cyclase n=1 Tax=Dyella sp. TaxID=1869338 RepID=UPI002D7A0C61|nr:PAS domain S-box protein [Dyella sp.]HET6432930.1 PAS domain S-box protein [Dyella sp.]